jgi:DNA-binding response OmpR family regulator
MKKVNIFLVEDDESFGSVLQSYLEMNDYQVVWQKDGHQALREFTPHTYQLCVLDIMLPKMDGFALAREIKSLQPDIPLVFLTAKTLKKDVLQGYNLGADDYITKPFDSDVLLCKIQAILNRRAGASQRNEPVTIGSYQYDPVRRILQKGDVKRKLSPKEGHLLQLLAAHINNILDREKALRQVWGQNDYFTGRSMDVYITRLRKYLKDDASISIENVHGSGFVLRIDPDTE